MADLHAHIRRRALALAGGEQDLPHTLGALVDLVVPVLAAGCAIQAHAADGTLSEVAQRGLESHGSAAARTLPIRAGDATLGQLTAVAADGDSFDSALLSALEDIADCAALAMQRAQSIEREQAAREHLTYLQTLTAGLATARTSAEVAALIVNESRRTLRAETATFYLATPTGGLELVAEHGIPAEHLDGLRFLPPDAELPGPWVLRTGRAVWIESFEQYNENWPALAARMRAQGRMPCFAALPVAVGDRVLGVFGFGYRQARKFDDADRSFAATLAHACAQAFERARLQEAELTRSDGFRLLAQASDVLSSSLDYDATLENVVRLAMPSLADFCFFDVREADGEVRRIPGAYDDLEVFELLSQTRWMPAPPELGVCALSSGTSGFHPAIDDVWMARIAAGPEHLELLKRLRLCSMITVPLSHGQRLMGALTLCFGRSGRSHTRQDVALAEEIARRAALAVEHARLYQEAARANRAKDVFLGVVSHELRTPLTAILGWSSFLDDAKRRRMRDIDEPLRVIHQSAVALTHLVDDILDVSRVIAGKLEIARQPVALASVISGAHETVRPAIEEKRIEIQIESSSDGLVVGDAQRLCQVVINLLTNAVKFTPQGGKVLISLRNEGSAVVLEVRDNGRGIEREELVGVFDAFRQIDSSTTRSHGGLGLGLAIVRQLIELHGGKVRAESDGIGLGARFVVELPRAAQNVFAPEPQSRRQDVGARLDELRVLIVDDQTDARELTAAVLRRYGAVAITASSAAEAISLFESARPDMILSDIGMPIEDGYSLITRLRSLERQRGIARTFAAAFTAYAGAQDRARALEVGYDLHVPKPIEPGELVSRLAASLARARRRSA